MKAKNLLLVQNDSDVDEDLDSDDDDGSGKNDNDDNAGGDSFNKTSFFNQPCWPRAWKPPS